MMICTKLVSFPTRERGLKQYYCPASGLQAPSFPTRERGLKRHKCCHKPVPIAVVPYAGTWIETTPADPVTLPEVCRSLRGNVD